MLSEMCFMLSFFYPTRRGDYDPTYRVVSLMLKFYLQQK